MNQLSFLEPAGLKAISLWQPWASLVALGAKKFETRSWETPYRGPLLIHAAKRWTMEQRRLILNDDAAGKAFRDAICPIYRIPKAMPFGCFVALVDLVAIYPTDQVEVTYKERLFGDYSAGRYAWQLENVRTFEPIPARGYQALWNPLQDMDPTTKQMLESLYNASTNRP